MKTKKVSNEKMRDVKGGFSPQFSIFEDDVLPMNSNHSLFECPLHAMDECVKPAYMSPSSSCNPQNNESCQR